MSGFPFGEVFTGLLLMCVGFAYAWSLDEINRLKKTIADQQCELEEMKRKN